jgi:hypothetical protein
MVFERCRCASSTQLTGGVVRRAIGQVRYSVIATYWQAAATHT